MRRRISLLTGGSFYTGISITPVWLTLSAISAAAPLAGPVALEPPTGTNASIFEPPPTNDPFKPVPPQEDLVVLAEAEQPPARDDERETAEQPRGESDSPAAPAEAQPSAADDPPAETPANDVIGTAPETSADATASPMSAPEAVPDVAPAEAQPKAALPREVQTLQPRIQKVLDFYYRQPPDATKYDVWEAMHAFLPYGVDAQIRTPQFNTPVNAIGWICWNGPCRGHRLFELRDGQLIARQGPRVQGHHGQFLAMLAQSAVSQDYQIRVENQEFTVVDLIEFEKATCRPKTELTFKLLALSYYLPAEATWKSNDGQTWTLERLLREEIAQNVVGAACGGTHRLTGIAYAVRNRKKAGLPMDGVWAQAEQYLDAYHQYTFRLQNPDGSFSTSWFEGRGMQADIDRRLQTSGHILEFLVFSLPEEQLTSPELVKGVEYITTLLERNPRHQWSIGPKGHALHALTLYERRMFGTKPGSRSRDYVTTAGDF